MNNKKKLKVKIKRNEQKIKEYERINNNLKTIKKLNNANDIKDVLSVNEEDDEYYFEEVYEIECSKCSSLIEINNNDTEVTCLKCGSIIEIDWE